MKDRKPALEKLSSSDQLDRAIRIVSPMSWIALLAAALIAAALIAWVFIGTVRESITVYGSVVSPMGTNAIYTGVTGTVTEIYVDIGSELHADMPVMEIETPLGGKEIIRADQAGTVCEIVAGIGSGIVQNNEILRISPAVQGNQVILCCVPVSDVRQLQNGMKAYVELVDADSRIYGSMIAHVVNIDARAASRARIESIVGEGNGHAEQLTGKGTVKVVTLELLRDENTVSGYYWTNQRGGRQPVETGTLCSARLIIRETAPIRMVFPEDGDGQGV